MINIIGAYRKRMVNHRLQENLILRVLTRIN
jgi:hypothetical protein